MDLVCASEALEGLVRGRLVDGLLTRGFGNTTAAPTPIRQSSLSDWGAKISELVPTVPSPTAAPSDGADAHRLDVYGNTVLADGTSCELRPNGVLRSSFITCSSRLS
jgi:hypothetical protein